MIIVRGNVITIISTEGRNDCDRQETKWNQWAIAAVLGGDKTQTLLRLRWHSFSGVPVLVCLLLHTDVHGTSTDSRRMWDRSQKENVSADLKVQIGTVYKEQRYCGASWNNQQTIFWGSNCFSLSSRNLTAVETDNTWLCTVISSRNNKRYVKGGRTQIQISHDFGIELTDACQGH